MKKCLAVLCVLACSSTFVFAQSRGNAGGVAYIEPGQPQVVLHPTVEQAQAAKGAGGTGSSNLYYHGGTSDGSVGAVGVETAPKVFVVFWGSQWNNNDPKGEACVLVGAAGCPSGTSANFLGNVGGSSWLNSVTQYCQGVVSGTYVCNGGQPAGNPKGILASYWYDNASAAPSRPSQSQLANEAIRAAAYFGNLGFGTTSATNNATTQYVIATATGNSASGFGVRYCAWHSSTTSSYGDIAYTNLPYITDAGSSCGANFNGLGPDAGISIVEGHELAETITDQFPNGGWLDSGGSENGDKCAWNSATSNQSLNGVSYPVQPLWSNKSSSCVLSY